MPKRENVTGQKFGFLIALKYIECHPSQGTLWLFYCGNCKSEKILSLHDVKRGKTSSCGCFRKQERSRKNIKHGLCSSGRMYRIWKGIKARCTNNHNPSFKNYGGRGITICDEWKNDFQKFYDWSLDNNYQNNLQIDRIDNNGNYEPSNCRWTDRQTQMNNCRINRNILYKKLSKTLAQWARHLNIPYKTLYQRLVRYKSVKKAFETKYVSNKEKRIE